MNLMRKRPQLSNERVYAQTIDLKDLCHAEQGRSVLMTVSRSDPAQVYIISKARSGNYDSKG
jgi:hypothetical protein